MTVDKSKVLPNGCKLYTLKRGQRALNITGLDILLAVEETGGHPCTYCQDDMCFVRQRGYIPDPDEETPSRDPDHEKEKHIRAQRQVTETYGIDADIEKSCPGNDWRGMYYLMGVNPNE